MTNAQEIKSIILKIGKATITFQPNIKNFSFNGNSPIAIPTNYYTELHSKFREKLLIQLKENCDAKLLDKYISYTEKQIENLNTLSNNHRINYVFSKSKNELAEEADSTHDDIISILSTQKSVLLKIKSKLKDELEFVGFRTSADYQNESEKQILDIDSSSIPFSHSGRATFKMRKNESLMLIHLLEKFNLLEFKDRMHKIKFIESNFNYTEMNKKAEGYNEPKIMKGTGKEFTNFNEYSEFASSKSTFEKLKEKLEVIMDYTYSYKKNELK